jgi:hypothetical protein
MAKCHRDEAINIPRNILCNLTESASSVAPSIKIIGRDLKTGEKREIFCEFPTCIMVYIVLVFRGCRAGETKQKSRLGGLESSCLFSTKV